MWKVYIMTKESKDWYHYDTVETNDRLELLVSLLKGNEVITEIKVNHLVEKFYFDWSREQK